MDHLFFAHNDSGMLLLTQGPWAVFFALMIGHALADYPLQGKFLAIRKNRHIKAVDYGGDSPATLWVYCLAAHSLVHAGVVWALTGSVWLGFAEFILHAMIDFAKCEKWTNFHSDQFLHMACKIGYVIYLALAGQFALQS